MTATANVELVEARLAGDDEGMFFRTEHDVGWFGQARASGHWADLVFGDGFDFDTLDVSSVSISDSRRRSVGEDAIVVYERAGGSDEALVVARLLAGSEDQLEISVISAATLCAVGFGWQANANATSYEKRFSGSVVANLAGERVAMYTTDCLEGGRAHELATLRFDDEFFIERFGFLELVATNAAGVSLPNVSSLVRLSQLAVLFETVASPSRATRPPRYPQRRIRPRFRLRNRCRSRRRPRPIDPVTRAAASTRARPSSCSNPRPMAASPYTSTPSPTPP